MCCIMYKLPIRAHIRARPRYLSRTNILSFSMFPKGLQIIRWSILEFIYKFHFPVIPKCMSLWQFRCYVQFWSSPEDVKNRTKKTVLSFLRLCSGINRVEGVEESVPEWWWLFDNDCDCNYDDHILIRLIVYLSTMNPENFGWGWEVKN